MAFQRLPLLLVLFVLNVPPLSVGQDSNDLSAASYTLCEGSPENVNFRIKVRPKDKGGQKGKTLSAKFKGKTRQENLDGKIEQANVKDVIVISKEEICFQAFVVDTTIIVDQPTDFKMACPTPTDDDALPCKELGSKVKPVLICPQALTDLLMKKEIIQTEPSERPGPNSFKTPTYDITNDMRQASLVIADGLTQEFNKVVKNRRNVFNAAKNTDFRDIGKKLGSFSSFLDALGPMLGIFGGITSIITTFLTPNPFDEMVKYLAKEFDEVNRRLTYIETDIQDLKKVVQSENNIVAMASQMKAIRYSLRAYEPMVKSLSNAPVCGSKNLLKRPEVRAFMKQYTKDNVENSLKDLYGVDFGEVLEASSLMKSFMRAYCGKNPAKVERFMTEISNYAYAGSMVHFAFRALECRKPKRKRPIYCKNEEEEKDEGNELLNKLYRFLKKANAMKEAIQNPPYGLQLDMQPDLDDLIKDEVLKATNKKEFPGILDKVYDFIIKTLYDINDWPEACIVNLKPDSVVIIQVAQLIKDAVVYGYDYKPWALGYEYTDIGLEKTKYRVRGVGRGFRHTLVTDDMQFQPLYKEGDKSCKCQQGPKLKESCNVTAWQHFPPQNWNPPFEYHPFEDRILYFLFNPMSYLIRYHPSFNSIRNRIKHTPIVVTNLIPIYVFYKEKSFTKDFCKFDSEPDVVVACLHYLKYVAKNQFYDMTCRGPDPSDPNRGPLWPEFENYVAIVSDKL